MPIFQSKPKQTSQRPAPSQSSRPSAKPVQPAPSVPKAGTSPTSGLLLGEIRETKGKAQEAVNLLEAMTAPSDGEQPSQISEILSALMAVVESQRRQEQQLEMVQRTLDRLFRLAQPRPV